MQAINESRHSSTGATQQHVLHFPTTSSATTEPPITAPLCPSDIIIVDWIRSILSDPFQWRKVVESSAKWRSPNFSQPDVVDTSRAPRPRNSFIIFRSVYCAALKSQQQGQRHGDQQKEISKATARVWRGLPAHLRKFFDQQAEIELIEHQTKFPRYRFKRSKDVIVIGKQQKPAKSRKLKLPVVVDNHNKPRHMVHSTTSTTTTTTSNAPPSTYIPVQTQKSASSPSPFRDSVSSDRTSSSSSSSASSSSSSSCSSREISPNTSPWLPPYTPEPHCENLVTKALASYHQTLHPSEAYHTTNDFLTPPPPPSYYDPSQIAQQQQQQQQCGYYYSYYSTAFKTGTSHPDSLFLPIMNNEDMYSFSVNGGV